MNYFINHNLVKTDDGYTLVLYLEQQLVEFAKDFDSIDSIERKSIEESIRSYVDKRFPNVAIKTVNIMFGALLVASLPFNTIHANEIVTTNQEPSQVTTYNNINYTVKYGDTLYEIATKYGVTVDSIKNANSLSGDMIFVGKVLKIPTEIDYFKYYVKSGDTLYKIGQKYGVSIGDLKSTNRLTSNLIDVGQELKIPEYNNDVENIQYINYTIKSGDYLYKISKQFNVSINSIKVVNNLQTNSILVGQSLSIPVPNSSKLVTNSNSILVLANKKYRLPSDYIPKELVVPNVKFLIKEYHSKKLMRQDVAKALEGLFSEAEKNGIDIYAVSGYRSYERQEYIFTSKVMERGIYGANQTSAKPGESEHQTGLTMDVTSPSVNFILTQSYGQTKEGKWLAENASKYGFIIRYPEGKEHITGYSYEPWHIRYVGKDAAQYIMNKNITLEEYLGKV